MDTPVAGSAEAAESQHSEGSSPRRSRWVLGELLGRGAFASVHLALDTKRGRRVAIKHLNSGHAADARVASSALEKLQQEIKLLRKLQHRNIVRYLHVTHRADKALAIVMEYIPGGCRSAEA